MTDFSFLPSDFSATEITLVANTPIAKAHLTDHFGLGCVSVKIRKSDAPAIANELVLQDFSYDMEAA